MDSLRARLTLTVLFELLLVLALAATLLWTGRVTRDYVQRDHHAQEQLRSYLSLSARISTELLRAENELLTGGDLSLADITRFRTATSQMLDELEASLADASGPGEIERESARAQQARAVLSTLAVQLEGAVFAHDEGRSVEAATLLSNAIATVDLKLRPLVDRVVRAERSELTLLAQNEQSFAARAAAVSQTAAALAVLLTAITGWALYRTIARPMRGLLEATEALAAGRLDSRVDVRGPREFAVLAASFNRMAAQLGAQAASLEEARRSLEQRVHERTAALERRNRQLRSSDRSRRRFFADVSHELRTPLTLIRGEAELALQQTLHEAEQRGAFRRILDLGRQMGSLVDDMLFLARAEAGRTPAVHLAPVDLRSVVARAHDQTQSRFERTGRTLSCDLAGDDAAVMRGDDARLRQLLHVLLDNAFHYTRAGDRVALTLRMADGFARVAVADTGVGIEPGDLDRVFRRFYRGASARSLNATGTGLGLSVARSITKAHGGTIEALSVAGQGSTFTVRLPLMACEAHA